MSDLGNDNENELGSLAQSTRAADLGKTRWVLLFIGILTLGANGFLFSNAGREVGQFQLPAEEHARVLSIVRMIYGAGIALGLFFTVAGILVQKFPVPLTILSLVLYVGATAGFAFLDPGSLMRGIIIKVIIVVALGKSVQTALAFQRERDAEAFA